MAQTTYLTTRTNALPGMQKQPERNVVFTKYATTEVEFGRALVWRTGDADDLARRPDQTGDTFLGVAGYTTAIATEDIVTAVSGEEGYPVGHPIACVAEGLVWVRVDQAVLPSDPVFFRHTTAAAVGDGSDVGEFRTDADTARGDQVTNARFVTSAAADELALLYIGAPS